MPLSPSGVEHQRRLLPVGIKPTDEVMVLRFTGEVFKDYEDYLRRLEFYRQRIWTCSATGKSGLSYEEAITSEAAARSLAQPFPEELEPAVCRLAHHATLCLDDLLTRLAGALQSAYLPGEEVLGTHEGRTQPCRVIGAEPRPDGGAEQDPLREGPAAEYEVEWIIDGVQGGVFTQIPADALKRQQPAPARQQLRGALQRLAECEAVEGVKGLPCLWRVRPLFAQKYGLSQELPPDLAERLQQRKASRQSGGGGGGKSPAAGFLGGRSEAAAFAASAGPGNLAVAELAAAAEEAQQEAPPTEPLEETEARLPPGSVKHGIFQILRDAGPDGAGLSELIDGLAERGVKTWAEARIAKSSIASTCGHDPAFMRVGLGTFALRAITHLPEVAPSRNATLGQKAAAAIAAVQAKEAQVLQRLAEEGGGEPGGPSTTNTLNCPRCHRVHHPEGSPLVLCDSCPRAFHLACMRGVAWADLPGGEWHCSRCTERRGAALRKLADFEARKHEALERVAMAEREKDERSRKRAAEREQRDAMKAVEKEERERHKAAQAAEREAQRAAARRAARFPLDDRQAVEQEQAALRKAEAHALEAAAVAHSTPPEYDGGAAAAAAARAAQAFAAQRRLVEGPERLQTEAADEAHWAPLADALAVVEFVRMFGGFIGAEPITLQELRAAARWPLSSRVLPGLYLALLRCLLQEQVATTIGVFKSQSRRWSRCINDATWPEVLRRHLLFSRALTAVPLGAVEGVPPHRLDDQAVAVVAAKALQSRPWHTLDGALHLRLLASLTADVTNSAPMRVMLTEREATLASLAVERQKELLEEKRKAKEDDVARREEERALRDSLAGGGADRGRPMLPPDLLEYRGDPEDGEAFQQWQQARSRAEAAGYQTPEPAAAEAEARLAELQEEREDGEAARADAEAAHEAAVVGAAIRAEALGFDRADRHYWWFPGEQPGAIFVEDGSGPVHLITSAAQLEELRSRLNPRGCREKGLAAALDRRADELAAALDGGARPALKLDAVPRTMADGQPDPAPVEELVAGAQRAAARAAAEALEAALSGLYDAFGTLLDGSMKDWRRRARAIEGLPDLKVALLEAEKLASPLMDGLPRNAHDEAMANWPTDPAQLLPPLPRDLAAEAAAANETRQQRRLQRHRERLKELRDEAAAKEKGLPWPPPNAAPKPARNDDDSASDDDEKAGPASGNGAAPPPPPKPTGPPIVDLPPLPELDISDAEKMELKAAENGGERERRRHPPRCSLWRTARERAVWLHDVQSAAATGDAPALAYAAAVYADRCQPLVVKAQKMAVGEARASRPSGTRRTAELAAAAAAAPHSSYSNGSGGGGSPASSMAPAARRPRSSTGGGGSGRDAGPSRLRIRLGGASGAGSIQRAENVHLSGRGGTPDTVSDAPSSAAGKQSDSPADDATGGVGGGGANGFASGAPAAHHSETKPTKLKLHFGGGRGGGQQLVKTENADQQHAAPPQQQAQALKPPWYDGDDSSSGLFPKVPTKKRRR